MSLSWMSSSRRSKGSTEGVEDVHGLWPDARSGLHEGCRKTLGAIFFRLGLVRSVLRQACDVCMINRMVWHDIQGFDCPYLLGRKHHDRCRFRDSVGQIL